MMPAIFSQLTLQHWLAVLGLVFGVAACAWLLGLVAAAWALSGRPRFVERDLPLPDTHIRTACQAHPGMCAGDPACSDRHCPGHPWNTRRCRGTQP